MDEGQEGEPGSGGRIAGGNGRNEEQRACQWALDNFEHARQPARLTVRGIGGGSGNERFQDGGEADHDHGSEGYRQGTDERVQRVCEQPRPELPRGDRARAGAEAPVVRLCQADRFPTGPDNPLAELLTGRADRRAEDRHQGGDPERPDPERDHGRDGSRPPLVASLSRKEGQPEREDRGGCERDRKPTEPEDAKRIGDELGDRVRKRQLDRAAVDAALGEPPGADSSGGEQRDHAESEGRAPPALFLVVPQEAETGDGDHRPVEAERDRPRDRVRVRQGDRHGDRADRHEQRGREHDDRDGEQPGEEAEEVEVESPQPTSGGSALQLLGDPVVVAERGAADRREGEEEADERREERAERGWKPAQVRPPEFVQVDPRALWAPREEALHRLDVVRDREPFGAFRGRVEAGPKGKPVRNPLGGVATWVVADPGDDHHRHATSRRVGAALLCSGRVLKARDEPHGPRIVSAATRRRQSSLGRLSEPPHPRRCRAIAPGASEASVPQRVAASALVTSSRPEASEKLIAMSLPTPSASRMPAAAPALTTAPPEVIGITPAAAPRQITDSAIVGENESPSAVSRAALPKARVDQQANR